MTERRTERRRDVRHPVEVEQAYAGRRFVAYARNIGAGGMFLESPEPFVQGDFVRVKFAMPGTSSHLALEAQVVRADPGDPVCGRPAGVGIRFLDAPDWVVAEVRRFVEQGERVEETGGPAGRAGPATRARTRKPRT